MRKEEKKIISKKIKKTLDFKSHLWYNIYIKKGRNQKISKGENYG
jgi:hypothetical protein